MYTKEQVKESTLKYFKGDELAASVWMDKYCLKNNKGEYLELNPDMMHRRLAKYFVEIEQKYPNPLSEEEIYDLFKGFQYIVPQGRVMAGLGVEDSYRSLSNCLVLPSPNDSYSSILYVDTMLVNAAKRGCGYGIDLSNLRPDNAVVKNASKTSTGIIPFMERYSNSTREVGQDSRRGACLLGLDIKHPQSMDFASVKVDLDKVTGANISLKIDNKFFEAVENKKDYMQVFPVDLDWNDHVGFYESNFNGSIEYDKLYSLEYHNDPFEEYSGCYAKKIKAKEYIEKITQIVAKSSEPGIFIWDKMKNYDPVSVYKNHVIVLTNACGEQPMSQLDTCRLIVLNLFSYVDNPFTKDAKINKQKLYDHAYLQLRLGDDLVDLEIEYIDRIIEKVKSDPEPDYEKIIELSMWEGIKDKAIHGRRVGCGITGLGDMLASLGYKYDSDDAMKIIEEVMYIKMKAELTSSIELAKERGSFPDFDYNLEYTEGIPQNEFYEFLLQTYPGLVENMKQGRRNINWSTIAPTGTTSLMTQTISGGEPVFSVVYKRRRKMDIETGLKDNLGDHWEEYKVFHHKFVEWFWEYSWTEGENPGENNFKDKQEALEFLSGLSENELNGLIKVSPYYKSSAEEIDWIKRVKIQGILQKYTTSAISSTINLPKNTDSKTIENIYMAAWKYGCKGVTVYVDGSRSGVLIKEEKKGKRPESLPCDIYVVKVKGNDWIVLIGLKEDRPYEVFAFKQGNLQITHDLPNAQLIKRRLKTGNKYDLIANSHFKLNDISSFFELGEEQSLTRQISLNLRYGIVPIEEIVEQLDKAVGSVVELSKAVSRVLKKYIKEPVKKVCPECGSENVKFESGCYICSDCGNSKC